MRQLHQSLPQRRLQLRVRKPLSELWFINKPKVEESFLAMAIMGIVFIQNLTMLSLWKDVLAWIEQTTGVTNYAVIFTVAFAVAVSVPVGMLALASRLAARGNRENTVLNFARFGYALIPLDIAAHLAHNMFHLLAEGSLVFSTVGSMFGLPAAAEATPLASSGTILAVQLVILALGVLGSVYTVKRIAHRRFGDTPRRRATTIPYVTLLGLLAAFNTYLFLLPMAHRM